LENVGSPEDDLTGALPIIRSGSSLSPSSSFLFFSFSIAVASTLIGLRSVKGFATGGGGGKEETSVPFTSQVELSLFSSNIFFSFCSVCAFAIASWNSFLFSASVESSPTSANVKLSSSSSETLLVEDDELFREGFASEDDARITSLLSSRLSFLLRIKEDAEDKKDEEEYDVVGAHVFAFPPSVNAARMMDESVLGQVFL
jgi:hypothetical protein